jgi:hypothetical protein
MLVNFGMIEEVFAELAGQFQLFLGKVVSIDHGVISPR